MDRPASSGETRCPQILLAPVFRICERTSSLDRHGNVSGPRAESCKHKDRAYLSVQRKIILLSFPFIVSLIFASVSRAGRIVLQSLRRDRGSIDKNYRTLHPALRNRAVQFRERNDLLERGLVIFCQDRMGSKSRDTDQLFLRSSILDFRWNNHQRIPLVALSERICIDNGCTGFLFLKFLDLCATRAEQESSLTMFVNVKVVSSRHEHVITIAAANSQVSRVHNS